MQFLYPGEDGIDLEGKSPSLRLSVVFLQHVDIFSSEILPFCNGLFYPFGLGNLLAQYLKEGGLAAADVSLNSIAKIILRKFWVESQVIHILIEASR